MTLTSLLNSLILKLCSTVLQITLVASSHSLATYFVYLKENLETSPVKNLEIIINSKLNIIENVTLPTAATELSPMITEFQDLDKGTRALVYKLMLEKFNTKFDNLSSEQKKVLKEYIVNITDTTKLKSFVDTSFTALKESLLKVLPKIEDATAKIKVNEAINLITPVLESKKLKDEHIVSLLQYQELHDELNKIHNGKK